MSKKWKLMLKKLLTASFGTEIGASSYFLRRQRMGLFEKYNTVGMNMTEKDFYRLSISKDM